MFVAAIGLWPGFAVAAVSTSGGKAPAPVTAAAATAAGPEPSMPPTDAAGAPAAPLASSVAQVPPAPPPSASLPGEGTLAADRRDDETSGSRLGLGTGGAYGALGLQVRYDFAVAPWLHLAPAVSAGMLLFDGGTRWGGAVGLVGGLGFRFRLAVDALIGSTGVDTLSLHGTLVGARPNYGGIMAIGGEYMAEDGSFQRFTVGAATSWWPDANGGHLPPTLIASFAVGGRR